jgi:hypothetical protein
MRLQVATRRQRRPLDLRRADTFRADLGLRVRQNPIKGLVASSSRRLSPPTSCLVLLDAVADRRG